MAKTHGASRPKPVSGGELVREQAQEHSAPGAAVIATDPKGQVLCWDEGAEQLYGWTAGEALGRNVVDLTPSVATQPEAAYIMKALRSGESWSGRFEVRNKAGDTFVVHVTDTGVFTKHGKLVGIVGVSHRATESEVRRARKTRRG